MKRKTVLLSLALLAVLLVSAFMAGKAYAVVSCFTDTGGHWAESFICWLKDNNISSGYADGSFKPSNNITRAEVAVLLKKQADVPPAAGLITISQSPGSWQKFFEDDDTRFEKYSTMSYVKKATSGGSFISLHPNVPTVLYGKNLQLVGVELCYTASATAYLDYLELNVGTHSSAPSSSTGTVLNDSTNRTDSACRYYVPASPTTLGVDNMVNLFVYVTWTNNTSVFQVGRTTFVLQPTGTTAALPSWAENVTTLSESEPPAEVPSTSAP